MRVRTITYAMLRSRKQFENDRAEATVELEAGDTIEGSIAEARRVCELALDGKAAAVRPPPAPPRPTTPRNGVPRDMGLPIEPYTEDDPRWDH